MNIRVGDVILRASENLSILPGANEMWDRVTEGETANPMIVLGSLAISGIMHGLHVNLNRKEAVLSERQRLLELNSNLIIDNSI